MAGCRVGDCELIGIFKDFGLKPSFKRKNCPGCDVATRELLVRTEGRATEEIGQLAADLWIDTQKGTKVRYACSWYWTR